jgi:hypothetical protein
VCVVYQKEGILATFDDNNGVLWVGLSSCPDNDEIDKMWTILSTFVVNCPKKCILHLAHVDSPELEPPQLSTLVHIVSKIINEFSDVDKKCKRIIIQPKYIDDKVMFAQQLFVNLIKRKVPLEIIDNPKELRRLIKDLTTSKKESH